MTATDYDSGSLFDVMSLDCSGNMILNGALTQKGNPWWRRGAQQGNRWALSQPTDDPDG
jgi:hypothetical protein